MALKALKPFNCEEANDLVVGIAVKLLHDTLESWFGIFLSQ